jgi:hypothetical protein
MSFNPLLDVFGITTSDVTLNIVVSFAYYSVRTYSDRDKSPAGKTPSGHWQPIGHGETPTCELKSELHTTLTRRKLYKEGVERN